MISMGLNRRSFLRGASLSVATFVCGTVINPTAGIAKKAVGFLGQQKVLDGISIGPGALSLPPGVSIVDTMKAEKAFLVGFQRIGNEYAKLLQFIDVQPIRNKDFIDSPDGFSFSGKVGIGSDTCTIGFNTSSLINDDFEYMNHITNDVYAGVKAYFEMPHRERMAGRGSGNGYSRIMDTLTESDLFDARKNRG